MKFVAASALVAFANALTCADFPSDSSLHAGCHMTVTFSQYSCAKLEPLISNEIKSWATGDSCAASGYPGFYTLKLETSGSCIWSTRLTANKQYTDDQLFTFVNAGTGCQVIAKSRSESNSYLDNGVNYCNMWNVFAGIGPFAINKISSCSEEPSDAVTTCARY